MEPVQSYHKASGFFPKGEFEPQDAIWLAWAEQPYKKSLSINDLQFKIIKLVSPHQKVYVLCNSQREKKEIQKRAAFFPEFQKQNLTIWIVKFYEFWLRDNGPSFVVNAQNELGIVHHKFNFWGYESVQSADSISESKLSQRISSRLGVRHNFYSDMVSEEGGHEFNGRGDMMLVRAHELDRNPSRSLSEITNEYKQLFSQKNIILIPNSSVYDDKYYFNSSEDKEAVFGAFATHGHIDGYARFVAHDTIVYQGYFGGDNDEEDQEERRRLAENLESLRRALSSMSGRPFRLIEMPEAVDIEMEISNHDLLYHMIKYDRSELPYYLGPENSFMKVNLATGYLNFLITNKVVLNSRFWRPGMPDYIRILDEKARDILQSLFPDRKVHLLDTRSINIGGGSIHCITNNQPKSNFYQKK